jgi:hypothetical protein
MTADYAARADVIVIPVAPYDPYRLLALRARAARRRGLFGGAMLCVGAASVAFSITLAAMLALHF